MVGFAINSRAGIAHSRIHSPQKKRSPLWQTAHDAKETPWLNSAVRLAA